MGANLHSDTWISFNIILILKLVVKSRLPTAKMFREWVLYLITF